MKKLLICLLFSTFLLTACSSNKAQDANNVVDNNSNKAINQSSNTNLEEKGKNTASEDSNEASNDSITKEDISEEVRNYILHGQWNKPEAQKIKWSETFINEVDIKSLYDDYLKSGGNGEDLDSFANYITLNAPVPSNWEELFEKDLYNTYGEKVVKLEYLQGDSYQAYVKKDGKEVPYVVVSSRTGYFHG